MQDEDKQRIIHDTDKRFWQRFNAWMAQADKFIKNVGSMPEYQQLQQDALQLKQDLQAHTDITQPLGQIYLATNAIGCIDDINKKLLELKKIKDSRKETTVTAKDKKDDDLKEKLNQLLITSEKTPQPLSEKEKDLIKDEARQNTTHYPHTLEAKCIVWLDEADLLLKRRISDLDANKFQTEAEELLKELNDLINPASSSVSIYMSKEIAKFFAKEILEKISQIIKSALPAPIPLKDKKDFLTIKYDPSLDNFETQFKETRTSLCDFNSRYAREGTNLLNFYQEVLPLFKKLNTILTQWRERYSNIQDKLELHYANAANQSIIRADRFLKEELRTLALFKDIISPLSGTEDSKDKKEDDSSLNTLKKLFKPFKSISIVMPTSVLELDSEFIEAAKIHREISALGPALKQNHYGRIIFTAIEAMPLYKKIKSHQYLQQLTLERLRKKIAALAPEKISGPKSLGARLAESITSTFDKDKKETTKQKDFNKLNIDMRAAETIGDACQILIKFCDNSKDWAKKPHKKELADNLESFTPGIPLAEWVTSINYKTDEATIPRSPSSGVKQS